MSVLAVLYKCLLHAAGFVVHTPLGDTNELVAEAQVQDPNSFPADGALRITKAHTFSWQINVTKQL